VHYNAKNAHCPFIAFLHTSIFLTAHGPPTRFSSLQQKNEAISEHADALDATRERGTESYEQLLEDM